MLGKVGIGPNLEVARLGGGEKKRENLDQAKRQVTAKPAGEDRSDITGEWPVPLVLVEVEPVKPGDRNRARH